LRILGHYQTRADIGETLIAVATDKEQTLIHYTIEGRIACVALDRPPVNCFDESQLASLAGIVDEIAANSSISVLLIRAEGKRFCAGADIKLLEDWTKQADGFAQQESFAAKLQRTFARISSLPIPTIAAVRGAATGGGLELALACDIRIFDLDARVGLTEVRLGLLPGAGGTQRLAAAVGRNMALRLMLRGEVFSGREAVSLGLAEFGEREGDVEARARALAEEISQWPRSALVAIKACVLAQDGGSDGYEREITATRMLAREAETQSLIADFFSKKG
jgi:enoyl-CoA hydratase